MKEFDGNKYLTTSVDTSIKELEEPLTSITLEIPKKQKEMVLTKTKAFSKSVYSSVHLVKNLIL